MLSLPPRRPSHALRRPRTSLSATMLSAPPFRLLAARCGFTGIHPVGDDGVPTGFVPCRAHGLTRPRSTPKRSRPSTAWDRNRFEVPIQDRRLARARLFSWFFQRLWAFLPSCLVLFPRCREAAVSRRWADPARRRAAWYQAGRSARSDRAELTLGGHWALRRSRYARGRRRLDRVALADIVHSDLNQRL